MNSHTLLRLFTVLGEAALIVTLGSLAFVLVVFRRLSRPGVPEFGQAIVLLAIVLVPIALATWRTFRKLQPEYSRHEALAAAITFGVCSPPALAVALPLAQIPGGYAAYGGAPLGLVGALLSTALIITLVTLGPSAFVLWIMRRRGRARAQN